MSALSRRTQTKLLLAAAGVIVWSWGSRAGSGVISWVGIAMVVVSVLLRFAPRSRG